MVWWWIYTNTDNNNTEIIKEFWEYNDLYMFFNFSKKSDDLINKSNGNFSVIISYDNKYFLEKKFINANLMPSIYNITWQNDFRIENYNREKYIIKYFNWSEEIFLNDTVIVNNDLYWAQNVIPNSIDDFIKINWKEIKIKIFDKNTNSLLGEWKTTFHMNNENYEKYLEIQKTAIWLVKWISSDSEKIKIIIDYIIKNYKYNQRVLNNLNDIRAGEQDMSWIWMYNRKDWTCFSFATFSSIMLKSIWIHVYEVSNSLEWKAHRIIWYKDSNSNWILIEPQNNFTWWKEDFEKRGYFFWDKILWTEQDYYLFEKLYSYIK